MPKVTLSPTAIITASLLVASQTVLAQDDTPAEPTPTLSTQKKEEIANTSNCARLPNILEHFMAAKPDPISDPTSYEAYKVAYDFIESIADDTRADQTKMKDLAKAINNYLATLPENSQLRKFKDAMYIETEMLRTQSRRDTFFMNDNVSRLIRCEGPELLHELSVISTGLKEKEEKKRMPVYELTDRLANFTYDMNELTYKFTSTRQFYAGLGISYAYIPTIESFTSYNVDFSPFDTQLGGDSLPLNSGRQIINTGFSNTSYPSLRLTAATPYFSVDLMLSNKDETATSISPIRATRNGTDNQYILHRTTIESTLSLEYDVQARFSVRDIINALLYGDDTYQYLPTQLDFGIGVGSSGFTIKNEITTDFRLKKTSDALYQDLDVAELRQQSSRNSFNVAYWNAYLGFEISDQMLATLEYRYYQDDTDDGNILDIDSNSLSFNFVVFIY